MDVVSVGWVFGAVLRRYFVPSSGVAVALSVCFAARSASRIPRVSSDLRSRVLSLRLRENAQGLTLSFVLEALTSGPRTYSDAVRRLSSSSCARFT